jgi:hypothetical protein
MDNKIVEGGEEMSLNDLTAEQIRALVDSTPSLIYFCDECQCYHVQPDKTMNDVDKWILDNLAD